MRALTFFMIAVVIAVADQLSKWSVSRNVPPSGRPLILGIFSLTPTHNTGGAFSLLQAHNWLFLTIGCVALLALVAAFFLQRRRDLVVSAALALALGGAIGNLIDRATLGYVRDFFHLHDFEGRTLWPVFNIADSAITVAVVLLAYRALRPAREREPAPASDTPAS